jgi:hypothetical protein
MVKTTTLAMIEMVTSNENPLMATPNATPEDGGCSVSITTMMKIDSPTAMA